MVLEKTNRGKIAQNFYQGDLKKSRNAQIKTTWGNFLRKNAEIIEVIRMEVIKRVQYSNEKRMGLKS